MATRRKTAPQQIDKKIFRNTAAKSKLINVVPTVMRGGIRL